MMGLTYKVAMYIPFFKRFKNKECSFNTLSFGEVCMGFFWTFLNYLNPCFSDTYCYFSFLGYVQYDYNIAFDPLSLTNPQRIMKTVPYKMFFFWENVFLLDLSTQQLAFENHRLVFFRTQMDQHFTTPPPFQMQNPVFISEYDVGE